ncbi:secreted protein [Candidatus Magnetoovum chiemensis]|nr:secreted protein [Candidatus Magnetoovum chiemensis]
MANFLLGVLCCRVVAALVFGTNCGVDACEPQQHQFHANPFG